MVKILFIFLLVLSLAALVVADDTKKETSFWDTLRSKIEKVTPTKKATVTTAVGGVRGAKNESGSELYWKGKEEKIEIAADELALFNSAMDTAIGGEANDAITLFESFVSNYPESLLHADSLLALKHLRVQQ